MLLDTASLYFRAYFGVPDSVTAPDGTPVNAVRGLMDFISRLVGEYHPTHLACCWDNDWRPQWRVDLLPTYKAHRVVEEVASAPDVEEVPDPLETQVPIILDVLEAFGIAVVGADEHEADDVIGTLATDAGMPVDIVTGDRDLFQLVDDAASVRVLYVARGVSRHERVDEAWVRARYGIEARQYADFATLRGDASDGLPGVAGVGDKTAATLLGRFGTIEALLAAVDDPELRAGAGAAGEAAGRGRLPGGGADGRTGGARPGPRVAGAAAARLAGVTGRRHRAGRAVGARLAGGAPHRGTDGSLTTFAPGWIRRCVPSRVATPCPRQ